MGARRAGAGTREQCRRRGGQPRPLRRDRVCRDRGAPGPRRTRRRLHRRSTRPPTRRGMGGRRGLPAARRRRAPSSTWTARSRGSSAPCPTGAGAWGCASPRTTSRSPHTTSSAIRTSASNLRAARSPTSLRERARPTPTTNRGGTVELANAFRPPSCLPRGVPLVVGLSTPAALSSRGVVPRGLVVGTPVWRRRSRHGAEP